LLVSFQLQLTTRCEISFLFTCSSVFFALLTEPLYSLMAPPSREIYTQLINLLCISSPLVWTSQKRSSWITLILSN